MAPDLDCMSPALLMEGYLRKSKKWSKRYFVLREGPPPCLEYYDSAKRKAGKRRRVIDLKNAWNIDKKVSSKHKHLIGIYTETDYFAMGAENDTEQEMWVQALQKAVLGSKGHLMYRHVWQGTVDIKDLECSNTTRVNLQGPHRCCLTDKTMVFVRVGGANSSSSQGHKTAGSGHSHVEIAIGSIRSCGHKDNLFFMELGRSSGIGTGKLWMELEDSTVADNMHKTISTCFWNLAQGDSRQRSCSFGSGTYRPLNSRSRQYYNPPPSQVGLGKSANVYHQKPSATAYALSRNRCETFPTSQATSLARESWYRTSSEGETTMRRGYPMHALAYRRRPGTVSSVTRVYPKGKHSQLLPPSFRTPSPSGSYTSSSNSSMEHINGTLDCTLNGQSSAASEGRGASDEYVPPSYILSHTQLRHSLLSCGFEMAPPPPSIPPETTPVLSTVPTSSVLDSEYASMSSRCHSIDGNFSCSTGASSLSSSPRNFCLLGASSSAEMGPLHSRTQSQSSSHITDSRSGGSPDCSTPRGHCSIETYPHEQSAAHNQLPADYTPMAPGRGAGTPVTTAPTEDKSGYVPMKPLIQSQPKDILFARRRSLSDNCHADGSYPFPSADKPYGKKGTKYHGDLPHSYPFHCDATASISSLKADARNDFGFERRSRSSKSPRRGGTPPLANHSEDYATMNGLSRAMAGIHLRSGEVTRELREGRNSLPSETEVYHEYLPMNPMNASYSKKSVVGNVLSIAKSSVKSPLSSAANGPVYPHQQTVDSNTLCNANSPDTMAKGQRKRSKSFRITLLSGQRQRAPKPGRKFSLRINADLTKSAPPAADSFSNPAPPLSPPGGEYVSIDFDKAKKQMGPEYVTLTGTPLDLNAPLEGDQASDISSSRHHDSNRNILSTKQTLSNGDCTLLRACN